MTALPASKQALIVEPGQPGVDPRGLRLSAAITASLLLVTIGLGLAGAGSPPPTIADRAAEPAFVLLVALALLFAWGAFAGVQRHPYGWLFRKLVRPRLQPPAHLEDPKPPTFAQGVGLVVVLLGVLLHVAAVPYGLVAAAAAAFIASFLNAAFDYCLGCQIYVIALRLRTR